MDSQDYQKLLDKCIYDHFVKKGMHETAEAFANETDVGKPTDDAIESPEVHLAEWWDMFYDMFSSYQASQDPYAEAARTMDNVIPQVPYAVPASSAHSATPAHNISPVMPAFSPERSQEQCYLRTPEDEVTSNLSFLEMDRPIQRSPFVTDPSRLMEQIPYMPQQGDARMEPNADTTTRKAMLPEPDPSEAGVSLISCPHSTRSKIMHPLSSQGKCWLILGMRRREEVCWLMAPCDATDSSQRMVNVISLQPQVFCWMLTPIDVKTRLEDGKILNTRLKMEGVSLISCPHSTRSKITCPLPSQGKCWLILGMRRREEVCWLMAPCDATYSSQRMVILISLQPQVFCWMLTPIDVKTRLEDGIDGT